MKVFDLHRTGDALIRTIFVFWIIHITILIVYAFLSGNIYVFNAFAILDIHLLLPAILQGLESFLFSYVCVLIVYGIIYAVYTRKKM